MTNTLSAIPALPLPTVGLFDRFGKPIKPTGPNEELAKHRAKVRKARHEVEMEAIEYAGVMLRKLIDRALDPKTDPVLATKIQFQLLERGIGRVRDAESDEPKKQGPEGDLLNFLTAISSVSKAGLGHTPPPAIELDEKDITPKDDLDVGRFLHDLESKDG